MEIKIVNNSNCSYPKENEIDRKDVEKSILNNWIRIPGATLLFNHFIDSYVYANSIDNVSIGLSGGRFFANKLCDNATYHCYDSYFCSNFWDLCVG